MPAPKPLHIASPVAAPGGWDGAVGALLCGVSPDPAGFYAGLDGAYRAHVGGWSGPVPPVCPECLRVAMIAMGAEAAALDPSVPAGEAQGIPPAVLDALRAVLLFYSPLPWKLEQQAEWRRLTGKGDATTRVLCDTVRAALAAGKVETARAVPAPPAVCPTCHGLRAVRLRYDHEGKRRYDPCPTCGEAAV